MRKSLRSAPVEILETPRQAAVLLFLVLGFWYLGWRWSTINWSAPFFSIAIYAAEIISFVMATLHVWMCWRLTIREAPEAPSGVTVDVFIPTYNESVDLVRKTLIAAINMRYPHKTWLLDDGNRMEMRRLSAELGCGYIARKENTHAKAGNLNHALAQTSGEFVAIFDADHAPKVTFLTRTLGYFLNEKVAFVQTPQDFFNLDSYQHRWRNDKKTVWTEQSLFFRVIQRGKDAWNAAFFCGSCAIIRRTSLEKIGGFATGTVTEDLHTSIRIHANGFESVYHAEPLAFGIAPESLSPFITQRIRWGQGAMHVWRKEGILTRRGLSLAQRLNYFISVSTYFEGWIKLLFYFAPVVVLTTGILPLITGTQDFLLHFVPYYLVSFLIFEEVGRGYGRSLFIEQYNMTRFAAFAWSTLALFFPTLRFKVTPKGKFASKDVGFSLPQWLVMTLNFIAIPVGITLYSVWQALPLDALVANGVWACVNVGLAAAVLRFTSRLSKNRRNAYRFPIPLFASLDFATGEQCFGTIDDISDRGCRFYGRLPKGVLAGDRFQGEITLPDGALHFSGDVRSLIPLNSQSPAIKGLGCSMEMDAAERDRLEAFLFGTDMQWQINGYVEQVSTPLSILMPKRVPPVLKQLLSVKHWKAVHAHSNESGANGVVNCMLSAPDRSGDRFLLSFAALREKTNWWLSVFARTNSAVMATSLELCQAVDTASGMLYLYRLGPVMAKEGSEELSSTSEFEVILQAGPKNRAVG